MRVLSWATTLQADAMALAQHLDRSEHDLMVVAPHVDALRTEPIWRTRPLVCPLLDRADPDTTRRALAFGADVVVFDNHLPPLGVAPRVCSMWHGLGWKARPASDLVAFHEGIEVRTGIDPRAPNPRFLAQCYGEPDRRWRVERWGLDPSNCRVVGMPFSDLLRAPPYDRAALAPWYPELTFDGRPTVLLSFTWHYGRMLPGSWSGRADGDGAREDAALLRRIVDLVLSEGAQVLLSLHDRHRYDPAWLDALHEAVASQPGVHVKHKDERPDNLADLIVADAMVTNLSSFVTYVYPSGRPSLHIVPPARTDVRFAQVKRGKLRERRDATAEPWMIDPLDNGGLSASTHDEVLAGIRRMLREPDCCRERAASWLARHVADVDGNACARMTDMLCALAGGAA